MAKILIYFIFLSSGYAQVISKPNYYLDQSEITFSEVLSDSSETNGLKVLWWNILEGGDKAENNGMNYIIENLKSISKSTASPDVIILSEFYEDNFCKFEEALINNYSFIDFKRYTKKKYGFLLLSKKNMRIGSEIKLDWNNSLSSHWNEHCTGEWLCENSFPRKTFKLEYSKNGKRYKILPIHLLQPWTLLNRKLKETGDGRLLRRVKIGNEIINGTHNPLNIQIKNLVESIKKEENLILVGDFNTPNTIFGFKTKLSKLMSRSFKRVYTPGYTYPTVYAKDIVKGIKLSLPEMQIDHVFYSRVNDFRSKKSWILPFSGSDHYPLLIDFD